MLICQWSELQMIIQQCLSLKNKYKRIAKLKPAHPDKLGPTTDLLLNNYRFVFSYNASFMKKGEMVNSYIWMVFITFIFNDTFGF